MPDLRLFQSFGISSSIFSEMLKPSQFLKSTLRHLKQQLFNYQPSKRFYWYGRSISAPASHPLPQILTSEPYRELGLEVSVSICAASPGSTIVDIGANIGDSAILMNSVANESQIICIEASPFYFKFLRKNISDLSSRIKLVEALVAVDSSSVESGDHYLHHWGGTAFLRRKDCDARIIAKPIQVKCVRLDHILANYETISLVKTDTDGYDIGILSNCFDFLHAKGASIYSEVQITSESEASCWLSLVNRCVKLGYQFVAWDQLGVLITCNSTNTISDIVEYLALASRCNSSSLAATITNLDILLIHPSVSSSVDTSYILKVNQLMMDKRQISRSL